MALTKNDIVHSIYKRLDLPKYKSIQVVESLLEIMKKSLESGENVLVSGFGKFCVKKKRQRRGRNPQTAKEMTLMARRVVTFRYSSVLRNKLNVS
ncbi:MAG: integration host factor subunit alpha [Deltaproteobacteria bacterium]|nr:integration host factor subunit alpha [Deltaproteobacteria bacterium]